MSGEKIILIIVSVASVLAFIFSDAGIRFLNFCTIKYNNSYNWITSRIQRNKPLRFKRKYLTTNSCIFCNEQPTFVVFLENEHQINACESCINKKLVSGEWIEEKT